MAFRIMGIGELSALLGARHLAFSADNGFSSVAVDSRSVQEGALFFALEGQKSDGHKFIINAFNAGAAAAVVNKSKLKEFDIVNTAQKMGKDLIISDDEKNLTTLQRSAAIHLERFDKLRKIGITGSSGKTTTKEITAAIISREKNTIMNKGNLNSETGLPLSVFEVRSEHEIGIFELGMNRQGEISELADVLKPNIALITNIGSAHIEKFGSKDKIFIEKKNIFNFLQSGDTALIPCRDEYAAQLAHNVTGNVKFYGGENFEELEGTRSLGLEGTEIIWAGEKIHFALPGKHSLEDAMAAIAIAKEIPVRNESIKQGLESVKPLFGRLEILKGRTTVVRDCYNANPESTAKSIEFCDSVEWQGRKVYVIADMLELGETSSLAHAQIGAILSESKADMIFLFGNEIEYALPYMADKKYFYTDDINELSSALDGYLIEGEIVLLKGSRGCALERLTDMLVGAHGKQNTVTTEACNG